MPFFRAKSSVVSAFQWNSKIINKRVCYCNSQKQLELWPKAHIHHSHHNMKYTFNLDEGDWIVGDDDKFPRILSNKEFNSRYESI